MAVRVQLKNWDTAGKLLQTMPHKFDQRVDEVLMQNAELYRDSIAQLIEAGDSSWTPKGEDQRKRSGSDRLFIGSTGMFLSNIKNRGIRRVKAGQDVRRIFVGARYDIKHQPSGMSMEQIAEILQNTPGSGDRDLFGPAWERVQNQVKANLSKIGVGLD